MMFKDKKMEKMIFATGNIYRGTGTASKYVEDREHLSECEVKQQNPYKCSKYTIKYDFGAHFGECSS